MISGFMYRLIMIITDGKIIKYYMSNKPDINFKTLKILRKMSLK